MITAAMIGYYALAVGTIALVGYLAGRKNAAELHAISDDIVARAEAAAAAERELGARERESATVEREHSTGAPAELRLTVRPATGAPAALVESLLAQVSREVRAAERTDHQDGNAAPHPVRAGETEFLLTVREDALVELRALLGKAVQLGLIQARERDPARA